MCTIKKYGKPMGDVINFKQGFLNQNKEHLDESNRMQKIYAEQEKRTGCVLCGSSLPVEYYYKSHGLEYFRCGVCKHINGGFQTGADFFEKIYNNDRYAENYKQNTRSEYMDRLNTVYMPKVKFMTDSFAELNIPYNDFSFFDVGTGSGYFVAALKKLGLVAAGVDISEPQIIYGNEMIGEDVLSAVPTNRITEKIKETKCDVVSLIGLLSATDETTDILDAVVANSSVKYVYFNAQLFSLSCILESVFPKVYNRHFGGPITHIFSRDSLGWLCKKYNFAPLAEWSFGSDIMDMYRSLYVQAKIDSNNNLISDISGFFTKNADELQLVVDKSGFACETTILVRLER